MNALLNKYQRCLTSQLILHLIADPVTKAFLRQNIDPIFGFPNIVRTSWATAGDLLKKSAAKITWLVMKDFECCLLLVILTVYYDHCCYVNYAVVAGRRMKWVKLRLRRLPSFSRRARVKTCQLLHRSLNRSFFHSEIFTQCRNCNRLSLFFRCFVTMGFEGHT